MGDYNDWKQDGRPVNHANKQRSRGRGGPPPGGGGGGGGSGGGPNKNRHMNVRNQVFDSNGPDGRIRGNAHQVMERYLGMARDASSQGDRVAAENYYQHAEHYFRLLNAYNQSNGQRRPTNSPTPAEDQMEQPEGYSEDGNNDDRQGDDNQGQGQPQGQSQETNPEPVGA